MQSTHSENAQFDHNITPVSMKSDNWLKTLCGSRCLPSLKQLSLGYMLLYDDSIDTMLNSGILKTLRVFHHPRNRITDDGVLALAAHPHTPKLKTFNLIRNYITEIGIEAPQALGMHVRLNNPFDSDRYHDEGDL